MLALQSKISVERAAEDLVAMAGRTSAGPIAVRRALSRLQTANSLRPNRITVTAVAALRLAQDRLTTTAAEEGGHGRIDEQDGP